MGSADQGPGAEARQVGPSDGLLRPRDPDAGVEACRVAPLPDNIRDGAPVTARKRKGVLPALLDDLAGMVKPGKEGAGDAQVVRLATAEFKAMEAVVRAAKRAAADHEEEPYGLHAALARLERLRRDAK